MFLTGEYEDVCFIGLDNWFSFLNTFGCSLQGFVASDYENDIEIFQSRTVFLNHLFCDYLLHFQSTGTGMLSTKEAVLCRPARHAWTPLIYLSLLKICCPVLSFCWYNSESCVKCFEFQRLVSDGDWGSAHGELEDP